MAGIDSHRVKEASGSGVAAPAGKGLKVRKVFVPEEGDPFDNVAWEKRQAEIRDGQGQVLFEQEGVEVPAAWSQLATNVVASKYFYGEARGDRREHSVRDLIHRVARTITDWGRADGYFADEEDAETFYRELAYLCLHQVGAFNSPVWFNCGLFDQYGAGRSGAAGGFHYDADSGEVRRAASQYEHPQCAACFIQSVEDTMDSIMTLARSEAMLFKFGSGTGTDLSALRSFRERLSGGGEPSGPLSFLRVYDAIAGVVKSGGKTRRAAKMNTLRADHPDILEFIRAKAVEERKAWALIEQGYSGDFNGDAYASVAFQNENLSVRVSDDFLRAVEQDAEWTTHWVTDPQRSGPVYKARDLLREMAEGAWLCGDPGIQYDDTIHHWHTCKADGRIRSSNPCSEYMFLDDSACNLASLNLMKFLEKDGSFNTARFQAAVEIFITAQEIIVDHGGYPTETIAANSHRYRPLGLGYANLGCLLMARGLPYDGDEGRALAGAVTALLHGAANRHSARLAAVRGPFERYPANKESVLEVLEKHAEAARALPEHLPEALRSAAVGANEEALALAGRHGLRNAQVTVLAPTGTIGFMMDCDTTGVEPDIALVKYKLLAGGGMLKIVNRTVPSALQRLGYTEEAIAAILQHIEEQDTIEGAADLAEEHLPVFDCAFAPRNGQRSIHYTAHLRMMAAVQPFLSGAISKTVNLPEHASADDIIDTYLTGWRLGLKAVAVYRDGSKRSQPLSTSSGDKQEQKTLDGPPPKPFRRRMPATRQSITHKFNVAGHEGYLTVGLFEDGSPGELFITMAKEGSTIGGLMDCFGTAISLCLQYGVPLPALIEKFAHTRFEPSGFTHHRDIPMAKSLTDYIFRWLGLTFIAPEQPAAAQTDEAVAPAGESQAAEGKVPPRRIDDQFQHFMTDAPACDRCGAITVRNGACYRCFNCGNSMGCS